MSSGEPPMRWELLNNVSNYDKVGLTKLIASVNTMHVIMRVNQRNHETASNRYYVVVLGFYDTF